MLKIIEDYINGDKIDNLYLDIVDSESGKELKWDKEIIFNWKGKQYKGKLGKKEYGLNGDMRKILIKKGQKDDL